MALTEIIERGAGGIRSQNGVSNIVRCADGFKLSVIAGPCAYCTPRPAFPGDLPDMMASAPSDYAGPFYQVEVGFPSQRPEPWGAWQRFADDPSNPVDTVYSYVPVMMVRRLVELHGGEVVRG